ncbi:MAG: NUDIX domain-containing protein [Rhizobiaceae bacterium]|nr:NUDIX domain-containing protein [Rhizobiaceae bacterium]
MSDFASSYVGQLRQLVGNRLLLIPGTRIVIENADGNFLLQQRSDFGVWGLIGGNAERNESLDQVIVREAEEEAGIEICEAHPFGFGSNPAFETFTYPNGHEAQHFVLNFYCTHFEGRPTVRDDESLQFEWFEPNNLPELLPNMLESLKAYKRFKATGVFQLF